MKVGFSHAMKIAIELGSRLEPTFMGFLFGGIMEQIYGLLDPTVSLISYVGHSVDPIFRFYEHLADESETDKVKWLRRLQAIGITPIVIILETVEADRNVLDVERLWIQFGLRLHWPLTNMAARQYRAKDVDRLAVSVADWIVTSHPEKLASAIASTQKAISHRQPIARLAPVVDLSSLEAVIAEYKTETGFKRGFVVAAVTALNHGVTPTGTTFRRLRLEVENYTSK